MSGRIINHLTRYNPLYIFVGLYFTTTIIGNVIYQTPYGHQWPSFSISEFSWRNFNVTFGIDYWALLLFPFVLVPAIALPARDGAKSIIKYAVPWISEINPVPYLVVSCGLYSYTFYSLYGADALAAMASAGNAIDAVHARFSVLAALGFWPQMVMQSLLVFLAIYAVVKSACDGGLFWLVAVGISVPLLSVALILLNMKWPVVVFLLLVSSCVFVSSKRYVILKTGVALTLSVCVYFLISAALLRLTPNQPSPWQLSAITSIHTLSPQKAAPAPAPQIYASGDEGLFSIGKNSLDTTSQAILSALRLTSAHAQSLQKSVPVPTPQTYASDNKDLFSIGKNSLDTTSQAILYVPDLLVVALNRMAMATPYYYDRFTTNGAICGTLLDRIERKPSKCQPSTYIYKQMFGDDGFVGTAPAAINLYGYALGGWAGALIETAIGGILLGFLLALFGPAQSQPVIMAAFVMGGYAAYFMTQLPVEGSIIYTHGMLWWSLLVVALSIPSALSRFSLGRQTS